MSSNFTISSLKAKAEREGISMTELGQRGGRKAASKRRKLVHYSSFAKKPADGDTWWTRD